MTKIPENLRLLFLRLDLIAGVKDNQKISFKTNTYVDKDAWIGSILRTIQNERMEVSGISEISSICQCSVELYEMYGSSPPYGKILMNKIVDARRALNKLMLTYNSIGKNMVGSSINTSGILVLDSIIPDERRIAEGFSTLEEIGDPNKKISGDREVLNSSIITKKL
uniref:Uncharacterized protein n=1 Tax=viral metagenome TaxID=1070528 RepID=A0A6C0BCZ0_9ZZZZ